MPFSRYLASRLGKSHIIEFLAAPNIWRDRQTTHTKSHQKQKSTMACSVILARFLSQGIVSRRILSSPSYRKYALQLHPATVGRNKFGTNVIVSRTEGVGAESTLPSGGLAKSQEGGVSHHARALVHPSSGNFVFAHIFQSSDMSSCCFRSSFNNSTGANCNKTKSRQ